VTSTALWYASRSTGVVSLVLLTLVFVLGIMVSRMRALPGLPRFGTTALHRSLSLLAVVFLAVHIITAIADPYVSIGIVAAIIPFSSPYETFWIGLGAVSLDLIAALIVTSLVRGRIGRRTWRAVHWAAYAAWPVGVAHSFGSSTDLQHGWLLWLGIGCIAAVLAAASWRLVTAVTAQPPEARPAQVLADADDARQPVATGAGAR
jgi:sulfoxide reductase heme-binding subunit YedZ